MHCLIDTVRKQERKSINNVEAFESGNSDHPHYKLLCYYLAQSVFKNYDHDQDGYISQEEFEKIAASFPFSFCVMAKDW